MSARLAGVDVAVCKPVQTGSPHDDDLADVARLSGVGGLYGAWRYPEPLAPVAAAERAGMALPTRDELVASMRNGRRGADAGRGRGRAAGRTWCGRGDAARPRARSGRAGVGGRRAGAGYPEPHRTHAGSACCSRDSVCRTGDRSVAAATRGCAEAGNRDALGRLAAVRAVLPAGAGAMSAAEFESMSAAAFDAQWVTSLAG